MSQMMSFLPGPLRLLASQPSLLFDLTSDGPIRYISRQRFTGFPQPPPASCLSGVRVLITGATSGLGLEATRKFLDLGADVVIGARNMDKALGVKMKLMEEIEADRDSPGRISIHLLEMESLDSVDKFVGDLQKESSTIDIAVLNAGGLSWDNPYVDDGWPYNMQINFRSTAYLARRLMPLLSKDGQREAGGAHPSLPPRLVLVTSEGHAWSTFRPQAHGLVLPAFRHADGKSKLAPEQDYYTAKLFLAVFGRELARRVDPAAMTVVTMSPGFCASGFFTDRDNPLTGLILSLQARSLDQGAALQVHAATCADDGLSGAYLRDGHQARYSPQASVNWIPTQQLTSQFARLSTFAESYEGKHLQERLWEEIDNLILARRGAQEQNS